MRETLSAPLQRAVASACSPSMWHPVHRSLTIEGVTEGTLLAQGEMPANQADARQRRSSASSRSSRPPCRPRSTGCRRWPGWNAHRRSSSTPSTSTPRTSDLADHHVTLRRRTGGPDAGWHLKLPAGADAQDRGAHTARRRAPRRPVPESCATSCWRSCATGRSPRWRASRPAAPSTCCTGPTAGARRVLRRPGDARRRTGDESHRSGGSGSSSWPRAADGGATCWTGWPTGCSTRAPNPPGTARSWRRC